MLTGQSDGLCEQSPDLLGYIWTGEELSLIVVGGKHPFPLFSGRLSLGQEKATFIFQF
jgi:hypothetical protein